MKILKYCLGQLQTNTYFLINKDNNCLIVDPADEVSFILEEIQRRRLRLIGMLATHGHFDHLMAVGEIQKTFNVPLFVSKKDLFLVKRLDETASYFLNYSTIIFPILKIRYLNNFLKIKNYEINIINTPGHTPGSVCFYFKNENIIFTGDTLLKQNIGRWDFSYSDKKSLKKSIKKILSLPESVIIYPGHGEETTVKNEKIFLNKFF